MWSSDFLAQQELVGEDDSGIRYEPGDRHDCPLLVNGGCLGSTWFYETEKEIGLPLAIGVMVCRKIESKKWSKLLQCSN